MDTHESPESEAQEQPHDSNVILLGAMGSGKTTVGAQLARLIGYGFIDIDRMIEERTGKSVAALFEERGEEQFRELETRLLTNLQGIRTHVIALGGGAVVRDENWAMIRRMGITVWLNTPPDEIARRLVAKRVSLDGPSESELGRRPLLADLAELDDREDQLAKIAERMTALIGQRSARYRQASLVVSDSFSTPESTAQLVKGCLVREGSLKFPIDHRPYDRWRIM